MDFGHRIVVRHDVAESGIRQTALDAIETLQFALDAGGHGLSSEKRYTAPGVDRDAFEFDLISGET
ncbi:hypothetical protein [Methylobacterium brachiatum]|uniref:hypothetical protein n=1 Tax=Methylobacterium brachiatum TaxID=269660 RepID=UPI00197CAFAB